MVTMCGFETKQNKLPFQVKAFHKKKKKKMDQQLNTFYQIIIFG